MPAPVLVEFYGIPRRRAGRPSLHVSAGDLTQVLSDIQAACPGLSDLCTGEGRLAPHYLLSIDGASFVGDFNQTVTEGTRLLLLSADVGG